MQLGSDTNQDKTRSMLLNKILLINIKMFKLINGLLLQAAMCYIHIAALIAEYLKRKGKINTFKEHIRLLM